MHHKTHKLALDYHGAVGLVFGLFIFVVVWSGTVSMFWEEVQLLENRNLLSEASTTRFEGFASSNQVDRVIDQFIEQNITDQSTIELVKIDLPQNSFDWLRAELRLKSELGNKTIHQVWNPYTLTPIQGHSNSVALWIRDFHRQLMLSRTLGRTLVGIAGVLLLTSLLVGVWVHRKLIEELFTWRLLRSRLLAWKDSHNALGVWGLPFYLMIAWTGAFLGLVAVLIPLVGFLSFDGDIDKLREVLTPEHHVVQHHHVDPHYSISEKIEETRQRHGSIVNSVKFVLIHEPQSTQSSTEVFFAPNKTLLRFAHDVYNAHGDQFLETAWIEPDNAAGYTLAAMVALHYGTYGGLFIKALYFVLGCMLSLVIYSGMRLWFIRREKLVLRHRHTYVLSKFFVAFSIGLIFAYVALVSSLLLPDSLSSPIKNHTGIYFFLMWGVGGIFATKFNSIGAIISPHYFSHKR